MERREKILLATATGLILLAAAGAGLWAYKRANEVRSCSVILDDASSTIRMEVVHRDGETYELKREGWARNNPARQQEIFKKMSAAARKVKITPLEEEVDAADSCSAPVACSIGPPQPEWIIRVGENTRVVDVDDWVTFAQRCINEHFKIEVVGKGGVCHQLNYWYSWQDYHGETRGGWFVCIDIHNQKRLSCFVKADLDTVNLKGSSRWIDYLKQHGVENVETFPPLGKLADADGGHSGMAGFFLVVSRYTRMSDWVAAYTKLTSSCTERQIILCAQLKPKLVETPEERE